jgi:hypothetical protein
VDEGTPLRLVTSPIVILRFYAVDLKRTSSRNVDLREPVNDEVRGMINDSGRTEVSFVCSLPTPELTARRAEIQGFIEQATSVVSRPDGVLFAFENSVETAHALVDFILFEQQCCSSITYELRSEPRHSHFALQLRAPADQVVELQKIYSKGDRPQRRLDRNRVR